MAEVFALVAGVVGCMAAAGSAIKFSASLYQSSRTMNGAREEIKKFAENVQIYGHVVEAAFILLKPFQHLAANENTPVLQYLLEHEVFYLIFSQCQSIEVDIRRHRNKLRNLRSKGRLTVGWKWTLQKKEVEVLVRDMEGVKVTLNMTMNSLRLEVLLGVPQSEDVLKEITRLKRDNKMHVRKIKELQDELEETRKSHLNWQPEEALYLSRNVQKALQALDKCMVREGRVPGHPPPQISSAVSSISTRSSSRRSSTVNTSYSTIPNSERHRSNRTLPLFVHTSPELEVNPLRSERKDKSRRTHGSRSIDGTIPPIRDMVSQKPRHPQRSIEFPMAAAHIRSPEIVMDIVNEAHPLSDFLAVDETTNFIHLDPLADYQAKQGYIKTPNGHVSTIARLDENLGENLVTQAFAAKHQLENVELFDMDDLANSTEGIWVQVGDGKRERCVGKVTLAWKEVDRDGSLELPVSCLVCVHGDGVGDVVFGKRFLERKQHYWRSRRGRD